MQDEAILGRAAAGDKLHHEDLEVGKPYDLRHEDA